MPACVSLAAGQVVGVTYIYPTFDCYDPLGRHVVLMDDIWYGKILRKRPELSSAVDALELTLTDPEMICDDKQFPNRECYYRESMLPAPYGWSAVKVVVEFTDDE